MKPNYALTPSKNSYYVFSTSTSKIDFIADRRNNFTYECNAIYDENKYPLILTNENEYLEIIKIYDTNSYSKTSENFILKKRNEKIVAIYNSKGKKLISAKEDQYFKLMKTDENNKNMSSLIINILNKDGFTTLYDVLKNKELRKSEFTNTFFYSYSCNEYYAEVELDNQKNIKAIYNIYDHSLLIKADIGYLSFSEIYPKVIKEVDKNNKCHKIYVKNFSSFKLIYCNDELDLCVSRSFENNNLLQVLGIKDNLCKYILLYNENENRTTHSKNFYLKDDEYFEVSEKNLIKVMYNSKCIKILNTDFVEIAHIDYIKNCTPINYFELTNDFIKEYYNNNCIAVYSIIGSCATSKIIKTKNNDENIIIRLTTNGEYAFLIYKDKKCVFIKSETNYLKREKDVSYELLNKDEKEIIGGYIVKNDKNIGIFNNDLEVINVLEDLSNSVKIFKYKIVNGYQEDDHGFRYTKSYLQLLYFKCNSKGKYTQMYNEQNELLLNTNECFKVYENNFVLSYYNEKICDVYSIENNKVLKILSATLPNQNIHIQKLKNNDILFKIYDNMSKKFLSLYGYINFTFRHIINNYDIFFDFDKFLLIKCSNTNNFIVYNLSKDADNKSFCYLNMTYDLNLKDTNSPYLSTKYNEKNYIYIIDKDGFEEILSSSENIIPTYINDFLFFKVGEKIYNKVGNLIN